MNSPIKRIKSAGVINTQNEIEKIFVAYNSLRGLSEAEVARQVGVQRQSVNRWAKQIEEQGKKGLKRAGRARSQSPIPFLSKADLKQLEIGLKRGPWGMKQIFGRLNVLPN